MKRKRLTELAAQRARPIPGQRVERFDGPGGVAGLALRITENGVKSWSVMYRVGNRQRRLTIGRYPEVSLAEARKQARAALELAERGIDPAGDPPERRLGRETVAAVCAQYVELHCRRNALRTVGSIERALRGAVLPFWGSRSIQSITRRDALDLIDTIAARAPSMAIKVQSTIRRVFKWAVRRGIIEANPLADLEPPARERSRERVLTDAELSSIWRACEPLAWPCGPIIRLLIMTGARRGEVGGMCWSEVDVERGVWVKPAARVKSGRDHVLPLPAAALDLIASLPIVGGSRYVFVSRTGTTPVHHLSWPKRRLDKLSGVTGWRIHDLRRTTASGLARLGIAPHVVAAVLDHTQPGPTKIYLRHRYDAEVRAALERWADHVARLARGDTARVIKIA
jgi:integrase